MNMTLRSSGHQVELSDNNSLQHLEFEEKSQLEVKTASHQLLVGTEARRLDEITWREFCT